LNTVAPGSADSGTRNTENTSVVAPPMSTPTTASRSRFATFSMMSPTRAGVGMIGTGDHVMSFL
jgi:hypothetical protein